MNSNSLKKTSRIAGFFYLFLFLAAPFSMIYIPSQLVVVGDAATTIANIKTSAGLFRSGIAVDTLIFLSEIILSVVLYILFRPVSKTLSQIAMFFRLAMTAIQGINLLSNLTVLIIVSGASYLAAFEPKQLQALGMLFLDMHSYGVFIWQAFFSFHCFFLGYLIYKSGYFPRVFGILMVLAASGYLIDSFGNLLFPAYAEIFDWIVTIPAFTGEVSFTFWLLFKGANLAKLKSVAAPETHAPAPLPIA